MQFLIRLLQTLQRRLGHREARKSISSIGGELNIKIHLWLAWKSLPPLVEADVTSQNPGMYDWTLELFSEALTVHLHRQVLEDVHVAPVDDDAHTGSQHT